MIVCRPRVDYRRGWKLSAAFNVSQADVTPLELFREQLGCGTIRKAGNDGWYLEANTLGDIQSSVIPFFRRFPMVGRKAVDFDLFEAASGILARRPFTDRGLSGGTAVARGVEQRRQAAIHDGKNPQRLYAELSG
jgi:hypothetical protein